MIRTFASRCVRPALYVVFLVFSTSFLLFAILEMFPDLLHVINLDKIRYFAISKRFVPDPELEFVARKGTKTRTVKSQTKGDIYKQDFGIETPTITFQESYNESGFRRNSAPPPYDVLVIGDSYIQIGETDSDTLSEKLRRYSGLSTFNLGRGYYGPYHYLHLLRRYGTAIHPKYALFCFFDGNDIRDMKRYAKRANGLDHEYKYAPLSYSFLHRCSVKTFDLIEGKGSCERATSSVLIGLTRHSEKEETPWPDASLSESVPS